MLLGGLGRTADDISFMLLLLYYLYRSETTLLSLIFDIVKADKLSMRVSFTDHLSVMNK